MAVTIAGQPIVHDHRGQVAAVLDALSPGVLPWRHNHSLATPAPTGHPGAADASAWFRLPYLDPPEPELNQFVLPTGASRYGRGLYLVGWKQLKAIAAAAWDVTLSDTPSDAPIPEPDYTTGKTNPVTLRLGDFGNVRVYALGAISVSRGVSGLWVLPVVDPRFFGQRTIAEPRDVFASTETWGQLLSRLGSALSFGVAAVSADAWAAHPSRRAFDAAGIPAAVMLDAAALSIGRRVIPAPSTGSVELQTAADAQAAVDANFGLDRWIAGGWSGGGDPFREIRLRGHRWRPNRHEPHHPESWSATTRAEAVGILDIPTTFTRDYGTDGEPVPSTAGQDYADGLAEALKQFWTYSYHFSFAGSVPWEVSACDDYLTHTVGEREMGDRWEPFEQFEVVSLPPGFAPCAALAEPSHYTHREPWCYFHLAADAPESGRIPAKLIKTPGLGSIQSVADIELHDVHNMDRSRATQGTVGTADFHDDLGWVIRSIRC